MLLASDVGDAFEMSIEGYQFPEATNPQQRFSWYMISGRAITAEEEWTFRWQALTCDEPPRISAWLRRAAAWADSAARGSPGRLTFAEPNLTFDALARRGFTVVVQVVLDYEFSPPTRASAPRHPSVAPTLLQIELHSSDLALAADRLDEDIARYPDGLG